PVIRGADPLRRRQQVVVRERQVDAHHERIAEEDREADQPRRHQQHDEAAAAPCRLPPRPRPVQRLNSRRCGARHYGTPPACACFSCASICLSSFWRPFARSPACPACHLTANAWISEPYALPAAVIGVVVDLGFAKIFRNVLKCASGLMSGDVSEAFVVGTLRTPLEKIASAWLSVV